jgi:hypothetical protein
MRLFGDGRARQLSRKCSVSLVMYGFTSAPHAFIIAHMLTTPVYQIMITCSMDVSEGSDTVSLTRQLLCVHESPLTARKYADILSVKVENFDCGD